MQTYQSLSVFLPLPKSTAHEMCVDIPLAEPHRKSEILNQHVCCIHVPFLFSPSPLSSSVWRGWISKIMSQRGRRTSRRAQKDPFGSLFKKVFFCDRAIVLSGACEIRLLLRPLRLPYRSCSRGRVNVSCRSTRLRNSRSIPNAIFLCLCFETTKSVALSKHFFIINKFKLWCYGVCISIHSFFVLNKTRITRETRRRIKNIMEAKHVLFVVSKKTFRRWRRSRALAERRSVPVGPHSPESKCRWSRE